MYNPRKFNSTSKLSGCIQKQQSKVILVLPTKNNIIEIFEKTVTGGFGCVNTHLSFDTELLMPNYSTSDFDKMSIDESYKTFRRDDLKVVYSIKINNEDKQKKKERRISKVLKLDENNQYGFAMTKPMPTGVIKEKPSPIWKTFNLLLESVLINDPIGHLFVLDIKFNYENTTEKQLLSIEI